MSKLTKLIRNPIGFVRDGIDNYLSRRPNISQPNNKPLFLIGFSSTWKPLLARLFSDRALVFISLNISESSFNKQFKQRMLKSPDAEVFIWGLKCPNFIFEFIKHNKIKTKYIEDGFIRSVHLGSEKALPYSWCIDTKAPYFDYREPSDLEDLLLTYDFNSDLALMERSKNAINTLIENNISKYNNSLPVDIQTLYGPKTTKRILVIGQVEDDASIVYGCNKPLTNYDLLSVACQENPDAQIFYKEHPDVLGGNRINNSKIEHLTSRCTLLTRDLPLSQALSTIDHVYTITSLSGLEALLRDIKVTTLGCPFYSGWGLTDDRQPNARRLRKLSKEQLFAGAYLLYPHYFNPENGVQQSFEQTIQCILQERAIFYSKHDALKAWNHSTKPQLQSNDAIASTSGQDAIPSWFNANPGTELTNALQQDKPIYLYIPWIKEHGDTLIAKIRSEQYHLAPLDIFLGIDDNNQRREIFTFAKQHPDLYRRMLIRRLVPLRNRIKGVIFTFDWAAIMRMLATVCEELDIPRILIPHESVFVNRDKYYWDPTAQASIPSADVVLGWGDMQRDIFVERGYPAERIIPVGAPKFDSYSHYQPLLSRVQFHRMFGLEAERKTILFASQPLDSQLNTKVARESQRQAIRDLYNYALAHGHQLLVRLPPSKDDILGTPLRRLLEQNAHMAVDDAFCYLVSPEEALYHADLVTSVNSTMLFEGLLQGKPALSMKYVEFDQIWSQAGIPAVTNAEALAETLAVMLEQPGWQPPAEGMAWAAKMFSCGQFDGLASTRIRDYLIALTRNEISLTARPSALKRVEQQDPLDVVTLNISSKELAQHGSALGRLLKANRLFSTAQSNNEALMRLCSTDIFVQYQGPLALASQNMLKLQRELGRDITYMSPGFIHASPRQPDACGFESVLIDNQGYHFDSTGNSAMNKLLNSHAVFPADLLQQSQLLIQRLRKLRIARYNNAPDITLRLGRAESKKILVLDRPSLDPAMGTLEQQQLLFTTLLTQVLQQCGAHEVILHQNANSAEGYLLTESLRNTLSYSQNIHLLQADVHPHALLDLADEIYVIDDHLGFEALMADKVVHCFGHPFYAGWGLTIDHAPESSKHRRRTLEELFYVSYVQFSRYLDPETGELTTLSRLLQSITRNKSHLPTTLA